MTNIVVMARPRTTVVLHPDVVIKTYNDPEWAQAELDWYDELPWACPPLLWSDPAAGTLIIKTLPLAANNPDYRPLAKLIDLLECLEVVGVSHRDVHPGNIVINEHGDPLLIDWETAVESTLSYDLWGPDESGVPVPEIHQKCGPQWLGSDDPSSLRRMGWV